MKLESLFSKFVAYLERQNNFWEWIIYIFSVIFIRNAVESFICTRKFFVDAEYFFKYPVFYLTGLLVAAIWIAVFTGEPKLSGRVASVGLSGIILAPVLDWILIGRGYILSYLNFRSWREFALAGLSLYANLPLFPMRRGLSPGLRIEIYIFIFLIGLFIYLKTKKIWKAILGGYLFNLSLFLPASAEFLSNQLNAFAHIRTTSYEIVNLFFIIVLTVWLTLSHKSTLKQIFSYLRYFRLLFYGGACILGIFIAAQRSFLQLSRNIPTIITSLFVFLTSWIFAVFTNYKYDIISDRIQRKLNPVIVSNREVTDKIIAISAILSIMLGGAVNLALLKSTIFFLSVAFIYSSPPIRTKRFPIISTFTLGLATVAGFMMGYSAVRGNIDRIPEGVILALAVGVTLGFCAKDINDTVGDAAAGTITFATLLPPRWAKFLCGGLGFAGLLLVPPLAGTKSNYACSLAAATGALIWTYTALARKFDERIPLLITVVFEIIFALFFLL
ncbi:UbiA family prenyltransferase [bacterium]|nr:UbiA family prenyltransferase [bacterium]